MARPARAKRGVKLLERLTSNDVTFFTFGFAFFNPYDASGIHEKWEMARDAYMLRWMTFEPFSFGGGNIIENNPGTRPWAWWNIDNPTYRRKIFNAKDFDFSDKYWFGYPTGWSGNGGPDIESQAVFLKRKGLLTDKEKQFFKQNEMQISETH